MTPLASRIVIVTGVLAGLLFFKWFLIPIALGLFLAAILLYIKKTFHVSKWKLLIGRWILLLLVMRCIRLGWSQIVESVGELSSSIREAIQTIATWLESRLGVSLKWADAQSVFDQIQWIASSLPLWSFSLWFMSMVIDGILVIVYSFLFVIYEKKILNALSSFSSHASKYWELWIKKSAQYIWSLLMISMILWVIYFIVLSILWVNYSVLIAIAAALCTLVPTVWTAVWILGASIASYAVTGSTTIALIVFVGFEIVQLLEEYTILPAIAWKKLEINPLATIMSVVLWWILWWVAWIFLILPIVSIVQEIIQDKNPNHRFIKFTQ